MIRPLRLLWTAAALSLFFAAIGLQAQYVSTHHVREAVAKGKAQPVGHMAADQVMTLDIVLPIRDQAALNSFLEELYDSNSSSYEHFLTVAEFTERFGPSQQDYDTVVNFAKTHGMNVISGSRNSRDVQVKASVSAIENAFHVSMRTYQHPNENRVFYSPDREPTTDLSIQLWHVSGLDNFSIPQPMHVSRDDYAKAHGIDPKNVVTHATTGSGPSSSFLGSDMRAAYYGGTDLTGTGQTVGLLEYYGTNLTDLQTYYGNAGQTYPTGVVSLISVDGTSTSCSYPSCDDTEQTLDMTQALGMAPGLKSLVMYVGSTDTAIIGAMVSDDPLPMTIGCSWGWTPVDPNVLDPYFQQMAAQGQNFFTASGDNSTWAKNKYVWPADDPYVVSVGGTDLVTAGGGGPWQSETAWADSGGGISPDKIAIPSWQQLTGVITSSNGGSTTYRNGPDVAANANYTFYVCADQTTCTANLYGGTSFAAPMWAGLVALVNEQRVKDGKKSIGFINPTVYSQNVTSGYGTNFHDITSGTSGRYSAVTGYDLVTGWGSPKPELISALAGYQAPEFSLTASPASMSLRRGSSGTSTIATSVTSGSISSISLSASGQGSGVTVSFSQSSIPGDGSSTMTVKASKNATIGTRTITISATGGGTTRTTTVSLTVTR
jgi:subtilase family serine protease